MPTDKQTRGPATRIQCMKYVYFLLFGVGMMFLLYAVQETNSHAYQSLVKQWDVIQSKTTVNNRRSLMQPPTLISCNTALATLQPPTTVHPPSAMNSANGSFSMVTAKKYPPIDLEKEIPALEEIFKRTVIVTAISSNHFVEAQKMIGSVQKKMPRMKIVAYNLGLELQEVHQLATLCNVEVRSFNFSKYPEHVKDLLNYAWKPPIIKETLYEFGAVFWADSSVHFQRSIKLLTGHLETFHGFIPRVANYDNKRTRFSVLKLTHPAMFDYLKIDVATYKEDKGYTVKPQGGILYFVNSSFINERLLQPWVNCAMALECIAPAGSQNPHVEPKRGYHVHRYDQSALALLMYKNLRGLYHLGHDATKTFNAVMRVKNGEQNIQSARVKRCLDKTS